MVVGSFSKAFAITGWRCGYLLTNASVIAEAMKIQDCMLICASVPVQRAVAAVLDVTPPIRCNGSASFEAGAMFWSTRCGEFRQSRRSGHRAAFCDGATRWRERFESGSACAH